MKNILFLSLIFFTIIISKGQELPKDLIDRANSTDYIFEGKVISQNSYITSNRKILTSNTILISKILKGNIECGTIELITNGGNVNNRTSYSHHRLKLNIDDMGIFLCSNTNKELSTTDFYLENNLNTVDATFEKQSFISYWWNGEYYNASDVFQNFNDIADAYNAFQLISGLTFLDCNQTNIFTKKNETIYNSLNKSYVLPSCSITNISPLNLAGGIKDTLRIKGVNFGPIKGEVYFKDSEDGGVSEVFTKSQMLWTDTLITVIVPSNTYYDSNGVTLFGNSLGSGPVKVKRLATSSNPSSIATSTQKLHVKYSAFNNSNRLAHRLTPKTGFNNKYTYHCTNEVASYKNGLMKKIIKKAIRDWRCLTGVHIELGNDISYNNPIIDREDSLCVIGFTNSTGNILAEASPIAQTCWSPLEAKHIPQISEVDVLIDSTQNWYLDTLSLTIPMNNPRYIDFYSVILHEFGHSLGLNHTIDTNELMHYAINYDDFNSRNIDISNDPSCDEGSNWVVQNTVNSSSIINPLCGVTLVGVDSNAPCSQNLEIFENEIENINYSIYPNPLLNELFIDVKLNNDNLLNIEIIDLQGKYITRHKYLATEGHNKIQLNINNINTGFYLLKISSENRLININHKIIKK